MVSQKCLIIGKQVAVILLYNNLIKTPLILAIGTYNSKTNSVTPIFFLLSNCDSIIRCKFSQNEKKKKKKNSAKGRFRATLFFRKIKVAKNPLYRFFF